jgi:sugar transferase (PEP-CTERM system associated)
MLRLFKQFYPIRTLFFVLGEFLFICFSVFLAGIILLGPGYYLTDQWLPLKILLVSMACQLSLYYNDLYDVNLIDTFMELGIRLFQALGAAAIILALIYLIFPQAIIAKGIFALSVAIILFMIIAWRFVYKIVLDRGMFNQKIVLMGSGELADDIFKEICRKKDCGYEVTIKVQEEPEPAPDTVPDTRRIIYKKDYDGLCEMAKEMGIRKVVVAMKDKRGKLPIAELLRCRVSGIDVIEGNSFYEMLTGKFIVEQINPGWLIFTRGFQKSFSRKAFKRLIDIIASLILLVFLFPLIAVICLLIKIDSRGPVFFSQKRVGKDHTLFGMHKFRSMIDGAEKATGPVWAEKDDPRVTRVGRFIRKLRMDELPQLWNVLKGEMSFVGPRPERKHFVNELEGIIPFYRERFTVKPGITGWAQVSYRYGASVKDATEKLNYDLFYIKNLSIWMDLMVIFKTVKIVLFGSGAR